MLEDESLPPEVYSLAGCVCSWSLRKDCLGRAGADSGCVVELILVLSGLIAFVVGGLTSLTFSKTRGAVITSMNNLR